MRLHIFGRAAGRENTDICGEQPGARVVETYGFSGFVV